MKRINLFTLALVASVALAACGQRAATSEQAIEQAQAKQSVEEQVDYLISEANSFVKSQKFDDAITTAKYVLSNLDKNSSAAKGIIESAKEGLEKLAREKMEQAKAEANKALDDAKGKIAGFGK